MAAMSGFQGRGQVLSGALAAPTPRAGLSLHPTATQGGMCGQILLIPPLRLVEEPVNLASKSCQRLEQGWKMLEMGTCRLAVFLR